MMDEQKELELMVEPEIQGLWSDQQQVDYSCEYNTHVDNSRHYTCSMYQNND